MKKAGRRSTGAVAPRAGCRLKTLRFCAAPPRRSSSGGSLGCSVRCGTPAVRHQACSSANFASADGLHTTVNFMRGPGSSRFLATRGHPSRLAFGPAPRPNTDIHAPAPAWDAMRVAEQNDPINGRTDQIAPRVRQGRRVFFRAYYQRLLWARKTPRNQKCSTIEFYSAVTELASDSWWCVAISFRGLVVYSPNVNHGAQRKNANMAAQAATISRIVKRLNWRRRLAISPSRLPSCISGSGSANSPCPTPGAPPGPALQHRHCGVGSHCSPASTTTRFGMNLFAHDPFAAAAKVRAADAHLAEQVLAEFPGRAAGLASGHACLQ